MADPTQPTVPAPAFIDDAVPFGGRYELFKSGAVAGGTSIGWYCCESLQPTRPSVGVNRPNPIGGPNGFVLVKGQETMSIKAQIAAGGVPLQVGQWFQDSFLTGTLVPGLPSTGGTLETWVIESASEAYEMGSYNYQNLSLKRAISPP